MRHDLVSLKLFIAVAECANLTRAAKREHLAVSAVSKRMAELEVTAGTPLLERHPRGVGVTPAGQALLHYARQILHLIDALTAELAEFSDGVKGRIRMHVVASAVSRHLPLELESFLAEYPDVRVSIEERTGKAIVAAIAEGSADLGVIARRTPAPGLTLIPYHTDRLMIGVPIGHPLARRTSVRFSQALDYVFVCPHVDSTLAQLMTEGARACNKHLEQRVQASSADAVCWLVQSRLGITMLPQGILQPHVEAGRIKAIKLAEPWAVHEMCIVVRAQEQLSHITRTLIDHLRGGRPEPAAGH